jgi:peptidoglycan/xylan/chitin deacetylase (PgdA/CDA1 family)
MSRYIIWLAVFIILLSIPACDQKFGVDMLPTQVRTYVTNLQATSSLTRTPFLPVTNTPSLLPTYTVEPTWTDTPQPKPSATRKPTSTKKPKPTRTSTPEWQSIGPGEVTVPILMYHHIVTGSAYSRYSISQSDFEEQLIALQENGYSSITISLLVEAIRSGAELPPRPVVITFDDGNRDVYENAYPEMQEHHYKGVIYLVLNYMNNSCCMTTDQVIELVSDGWEVGSHSTSHPDINGMDAALQNQVGYSQSALEELIGAPMNTFAYPYAMYDDYVLNGVKQYYSAAVGVGSSTTHTQNTLYYLSRLEIQNGISITEFLSLLPW